MIPIDLVIPMAESGDVFAEAGFARPKPLLRLGGRPFFWWAAESVCRGFDVRRMVFVVSHEQVDRYRIDHAISSHYPAAETVVLERPASNALAMAAAGAQALDNSRWLMISHCDHAFEATRAGRALAEIAIDADAFICYAHSFEPGVDERASQAVRPLPGASGWRNRQTLLAYARMAGHGPEADPIHRAFAAQGKIVGNVPLDRYVSFATPEEYDEAPAHVDRLAFFENEAVLYG